MMMRLGIVGTGNVGSALVEAFQLADIQVTWYSRKPQHPQEKWEGTYFDEDIVLLAVPDDHIEDTARKMNISAHTTLAHVSGATPLQVLENVVGHKAAVFYPLQTIRKGAPLDWKTIPICLEVSDSLSKDKLLTLASKISDHTSFINSHQRVSLHLAAVMINNFSNHLAVLTRDFLSENGTSFDLLNAIILEGAKKLLNDDFTQTGPARRGDQATMARHLELLKGNTELTQMYQILSTNIYNYYHRP